MKIFLYGIITEDNFGGPSILHGTKQLIERLNNQAEIIFYQSTKISEKATDDMDFPIYRNPYKSTGRLLFDGIMFRMGMKPRGKKKLEFLENIKTADLVFDLFGICFCSNFDPKKSNPIKAIRSVIAKFSISFLAKMYGVKTVKLAASYGPIISKHCKIQANFASNRIFDVMLARERESMGQLTRNTKAGNKIILSPDMANLMPYKQTNRKKKKYISISVSYQIINQWHSEQSYLLCMKNLVDHILKKIKINVILIPNENLPDTKYDDIAVANEIYSLVEEKAKVSIANVKEMNSTEIKSLIAGSEALIASRYHSCVAGFSSGVPTLIIGWHHKYNELAELYNQEKWVVSNKDCNSKKLITLFDEFMKENIDNRKKIKLKFKDVEDKLIQIGNKIFEK